MKSEAIIVPLQPEKPQRIASDPSLSVWVAAAAGSGKTKILADRVLRLLLEGVSPQKILCLTFTRAAAAEMSIRITEQLARWAACDDEALRVDLDALQDRAPTTVQMMRARRLFAHVLHCPGGMRIRTIHAFAQEILRRFPLEAGLSPQFMVMEESDAAALRHAAQQDMLAAAAQAPDSALGQALSLLVQALSEDDFTEVLRQMTQDQRRFEKALSGNSGLDGLVAKMRGQLDLLPEDTQAAVTQAAVLETTVLSENLLHAARCLLKGTKTYVARGQSMLDWLALPNDAVRAEIFEDYWRCFLKKDGDFYENYGDKKLLTAHPEIEDMLRREAARLAGICARLDVIQTAEQTAAVLRLAADLSARYAAQKSTHGGLDYDDLIRYTDALLNREGMAPWVLFKLDGGIDHILVDEAQDTNPAQWRIVAKLAEEFFSGETARSHYPRTLFVVGDEKQSIFSFHNADPAIFAAMRAHFRAKITNVQPQAYAEVPLTISFRSAPAILRAVDAVFATENVHSGVAGDSIHHYPYRANAVGHVEIWPLHEAAEAEEEEAEWALPLSYQSVQSPSAALAEQIARQIRDWLVGGHSVNGRAARAGDIMILVQRRNAFVDQLVRALKNYNVPVTGVDRMRLTKQLAVMDLVALLQFVLLPQDDLNLATVLRGPLLGLSEEQLMQLAMDREGSLWQSLCDRESSDKNFTECCRYLHSLLAVADQISPFAMLMMILTQPCPAARSGRMALWSRLGADALDPIDELLNAAQDYGAMHSPSLQAFLHWLATTEAEVKRELHGADQVRITTVHASKGLEAPIVILPDTVRVPGKQDLPKILWHEESGVPFYVPREPRGGLLYDLRSRARTRQLEEYRRLMYVALTRPRDQLYICGYKNKRANDVTESWYHHITTALEPLHEQAFASVNAVIALADAPHLQALQAKKSAPNDVLSKLPDWVYQTAPAEVEIVRSIAPSQFMGVEAEPMVPLASPRDRRFARGRIIHRLLQSLPDVEVSKRADVAQKFLSARQYDLSVAEQQEIVAEVLGILSHADYAPLFGPQSRAEVPVIGQIDGVSILGQVDRLCVTDSEVWVVDYKTNRPPPQSAAGVPEAYRRQLAAYRAVLAQIYPQKPIRIFLLWTYGPFLMEVEA